MCGVLGVVGAGGCALNAAMATIGHRGPDAEGAAVLGSATLGHRRLSIIDLSDDGRQPMSTPDGRLTIVFNGEIYNYPELRAELRGSDFRTATDTEVLLAAWERWGAACLDRLIGMFAFAVWDAVAETLTLVRDRFGVKPMYWSAFPSRDAIAFASEIKALHALGVPRQPDETAWATYLALGAHDHSERTFYAGIQSVQPGHVLRWHRGELSTRCWYDLADRVGTRVDERPWNVVEDEYLSILLDSVRLRFRADVPVGINLSGGLDSSTLLAAVHAVQGDDSDVTAFTFACGDSRYDELPWVHQMLEQTKHESVVCPLRADDVPALAQTVADVQDEPYGGIPTLAYARLFAAAKERGVTVLLDGQGMDEQWAGYDYYRDLTAGAARTVQGTAAPATRPACLDADFRALAEPVEWPQLASDPLRSAQYRDIRFTKLQRAMRFNDRVSMLSSRELREPFLDHRLVELAFSQPADRKISATTGKVGLRRIVGGSLPARVVDAPKRALQTPQREWLRGPLRTWAQSQLEAALDAEPGWFDAEAVRREVEAFDAGGVDSSYHVWQWISVALSLGRRR